MIRGSEQQKQEQEQQQRQTQWWYIKYLNNVILVNMTMSGLPLIKIFIPLNRLDNS